MSENTNNAESTIAKISNKKVYSLLAAGFLLILILTTAFIFQIKEKARRSEITQNQGLLEIIDSRIQPKFDRLELARNPKTREQGLMYRTEMCDRCGMIFDMGINQPVTFWMKNTNLPLAMIFVDQTGKIVNVVKEAKPNQTDEVYPSRSDARYIIEIKSSSLSLFNFNIGQNLDIPYLITNSVDYEGLRG